MKALRLCTGTAFLGVLAAALFAAASPEVARGLSNCIATQLVPALGEVTVNQGLGNYAYRVRGKETLVKFFLTNPTTCAVTSTQSINITGATLTVNNTLETFSGIGAFQSFGGAPAVTAVLSNTSAADPVFAVPSADLQPPFANLGTQTFNPTFTATVTYSRKNGTTTTTGLTQMFSNPTSVTFDHLTRALRVLVVPMGDATQGVLASTQYTAADQTATQNGFSALSRIFPAPGGVSALGGTGGIRYTIDLSAMVNLKAVAGAYDGNIPPKFCGSGANFDAIKAQLAQFMQSWNANPLNVNQQADRVLGVVGESISDGADNTTFSCADGMASVVSPEAWVRAIADKPASGRIAAVPSRTGSLMAMELTHTWGGEPTISHHSTSVTADGTNPGRAYNVTTRSYLATNRSAMKYSFVNSPPWDDTLTLLEPADYSYDRCAFGGTIPTDGSCSGLGTTTGTTLGVAAGPSFVVSGTVDNTTNTADVVQSGFADSLQLGTDDNSLYRYVRRDARTHAIVDNTNIGFRVSFENTKHSSGLSENDDSATNKGLFSFALPDDLPAPGSDPAEVQLWKVSSLGHDPGTAISDTLLYDKTQQTSAPQPIGAGKVAKYTDTPLVDEVHPALSDGGDWIAWEAPLVPSVPGSTVIHVAPSTSSANAVTLPVPTADKHIVFESNRDVNHEIYSMKADGTGQTNLTNNAARDVEPAASPDGSQIAFDSDRSGSEQIWVMSAGGSNPTQLTTQGSHNAFPAWSPDGTKIAFMSDRNGEREIWVMDAAGTDQHRITSGGDDYYPTWSPDGQKIAFASTRGGGNSQIWVTNSNGGTPTHLTTASVGPPVHDQPSWSTDGSKIAFSGGSNGAGPFDVYVMNSDGSGQTDLTNNAADDRIAGWSPDGSKIAFTSDRSLNYDVYVMNADGSGSPAQVTTNAAADFSSSWSPARDTGLSDAFPAWKATSTDAIAYAFEGDLYTQGLSFPAGGGAPSAAGDPTRIYTAGDGPAAHHPSWSLDGGSIAFDAGGDIYTIPAAGGTSTQLTNNAEAEHDPSWSHTTGDNRIAYVRGPLGPCTPSTKLYVVDPATDTQDKVGDEGCGLFPSFGTNGRIAFLKPDGNIWSAAPDGTTEKQLTVGGQDSFPSAAGNLLAFDRLFSPTGCEFCAQQDIMLMSFTAGTSFSAESNAELKAEVIHEVNGTAYPVYVGLKPDEVDGAIQTWHINFDGSNAPSGGVLKIRFTDGVQYTDGGTVIAPTVAPKPPTAAIYSPIDSTYGYRSSFALSGTGYDAEGNVLPAENLHWTTTLPVPNQDLGSFASKDIQPPASGWPAGTYTFTLVANDGTLSSTPVTRNVRVVAYDFVGAGFLSPILNPPGVNTGKPGAQFPMKWQLKSPSGKFISDVGTVRAVEYQTDGNPPTCDFSSAMGPRIALPNGGTALRYDTKNNQFVYNWTTPTNPGCYVFTLTLTDGTEHQAYFKLS